MLDFARPFPLLGDRMPLLPADPTQASVVTLMVRRFPLPMGSPWQPLLGMDSLPLLDAWMPMLLADPPQAAVVSLFLASLIAPPSLLLLLELPFRRPR